MQGKLADGTPVEMQIGNKVTTTDGLKGYIHFWCGPDSFAVVLYEPVSISDFDSPILGFRCTTERIVSIDGNYSDDFRVEKPNAT